MIIREEQMTQAVKGDNVFLWSLYSISESCEPVPGTSARTCGLTPVSISDSSLELLLLSVQRW